MANPPMASTQCARTWEPCFPRCLLPLGLRTVPFRWVLRPAGAPDVGVPAREVLPHGPLGSDSTPLFVDSIDSDIVHPPLLHPELEAS